jgi:hypothetical protein
MRRRVEIREAIARRVTSDPTVQARPSAPSGRIRRVPAAAHSTGAALKLLYLVWAVYLFDLHFFVSIKGSPAIGRLFNYAFIPLVAIALIRLATTVAERPWIAYPPFILLFVAAAGAYPAIENTFMAWLALQTMIAYYGLAVGTAVFVRTPRQAVPILLLVATRFLWWALWSGTKGNVPWDPTMMNPDGFGGLMVQGTAICYWFAMATKVRWQRYLMLGLAVYCVAGVVISTARGAFLALVVVGAIVWVRSPRKAVTGGGILVGVLVVVLAANLLVGGTTTSSIRAYRTGTFWEQILSTFAEGTESGTGAHRKSLWTAAVRVWTTHPVFGVGPNNFGVFASSYFRPGEIEGFENTATFWGLNLHSAYFEILSEFGIVGVVAFVWLMVDFVKKNRALRRAPALSRWAASGMANRLDLRALSLGLEGGLVATFLVNVVYASLFEPWFISVWVCNRMLWALTCEETARRSTRGRTAVRSGAPTPRLTA